MKLLLVGNYGARNLGDDLLEEYFVRAFPEAQWTIVSARPRMGRKNEVPRLPTGLRSLLTTSWWRTVRAFREVDGVVFGGGSLLTDAESVFACRLWGFHAWLARRFGKPVFLAFQGIGPFRTTAGERLARRVVAGAAFVSVRDEASVARVRAWGLSTKIVQTFDPVFSLMVDKKKEKSARNVLIAVPRKNSSATFRQRLAALAAEERFREVRILSLEPESEAQRFRNLLPLIRKPSTVVLVSTLDRLMTELAGGSSVLSQRYHGSIAAVAAGVPVESLPQAADDKHAGIAAILALPPEELLARVRTGEEELRSELTKLARP